MNEEEVKQSEEVTPEVKKTHVGFRGVAHDPNLYHTLEGIQQHPLFMSLTDKQKLFLLKFLETNDKDIAVRHAFTFSDEMSYETHAARMMDKPKIRHLYCTFHRSQSALDLPLNRSEMLVLVSNRLRRTNTSHEDWIRLMRLFLELTDRNSRNRKPTPAMGRPPGRPGDPTKKKPGRKPKLEPDPDVEPLDEDEEQSLMDVVKEMELRKALKK